MADRMKTTIQTRDDGALSIRYATTRVPHSV